jgi:2-methylcitrate dehydratase PrpD
MTLARELAERIVALRYGDLPPEVIYWNKVAVLDTVGVTLAGSLEPAPRIAEDALELQSSSGPSLVFGSSRRIAALDAALINGVSAHVLDYDNTARNLGGHVSAVMVPALFAAADACGARGQDFLLAHAAGFEAGRIGKALNPLHSSKGWHPTATVGVFAVAAACSSLYKLSVAETETALAMSTSLAAGTKANFGTMTKSLHAGQCARGGLMAVMLARKGYTANPGAFEHKQGFFNVFNGPKNFNAAAILQDWCRPFDIVSPGASYKLYPCCYSTHAAIQAALELVKQHGKPFDPEQIAAIKTFTPPRGLAHTNRPAPQSALDAKFSVQYCVARALTRGRVVLSDFEDAAYGDPVMQQLLTRIQSAPYTGKLFDPEDPFDAEVSVQLAGGQKLMVKIDRPLGRTTANPIPAEKLADKFDDCAGRVLNDVTVKAVRRAIESMQTLDSVRTLTTQLAATGKTAEQPRTMKKAAII